MPHDDFTALHMLPPVDPATLPPIRVRTGRDTPHAVGPFERASPEARGLEPLQPRVAPVEIYREADPLPLARLPSDLWIVGWYLPFLVGVFWWILVEYLEVQHPRMRLFHALGAGLTTLGSLGVVLAFTG